MKKFLSFVGLSCIFAAMSAHAQTVSRIPNSDPFLIDRGTSFTASSGKPLINGEPSGATPAAARIISDLQQALDIIRGNHVDGTKLNNEDLTKSSITSMLAELDPHSSYFDAAEFSELLGEQDSEYSGTGSTISNYVRNGLMETYVIATHPDSAAAKANLQYGDRIIAIDGVAVSGMPSETVRDMVRGPRGTLVRMTIERAATGRIETLELKRERVFQPTLPNFFVIRGGVGYVDLSEGFSHTTAAELDAALSELHRRGMNSLLLDLRGNAGGILDQAVMVAERFLPAGSSIISQRGRLVLDNREWKSTNRNPENIPVVVLVNEQTASASEVVAGALQDNDRALILGQNTFGKGLVQNVVGLPAGAGLTLTTARYYTPSGRSIQRSYVNFGLYDYFNHRLQSVGNDSPRAEARTTTNRVVYGGNGIAPDEAVDADTFDSLRAELLDPIFFYVREVVYRKSSSLGSVLSSRDQIRQSIIFGGKPVGQELLVGFRHFVARGDWKISATSVDKNASFVSERLNYEFALAAFGPQAAKHSQIDADKQITRAVDAVPRAARLADAAREARTSADNKKTRRIAFPTGQGRNRRN